MKRVLILGCSGAGKTTLSLAIAERTGLPVVHLDKHYWRAGWVEPPREEWRAQVAALIAQPEWIMDGTTAERSSNGSPSPIRRSCSISRRRPASGGW